MRVMTFLALVLPFLTTAASATDSTVIDGNLRISGQQSAIMFPDGTAQSTAARQPVLADVRWSVMWHVSGGGVHHISVRADGSIRDQDDPRTVLTKMGTGQYCISAADALEGAIGVVQDGPPGATIQVSMGIGSFCGTVAGANITVSTYNF